MIWMLLPKSTGTYSVDLDLLDGDWDKNALEDMSVDIGRKPLRRPDFYQSGRRVRTEFLPTKAQRSGGQQPVEDFKKVGLAQICSGAFRGLVERFDPGVHQFEPLEIVDRNGTAEERQFYWFFPKTRLHALDPARVSPQLNELGYFSLSTPVDEWNFVFLKNTVGDHDVFCSAEIKTFIFISDRLKRAIEDADLSGVKFSGPFEISE